MDWSQLTSRLEEFGVHHVNNRYQGPCPIHKGDNPSGFCLYEDTGIWQCFTHQCHELYGSGINGLARALGYRAPSGDLLQKYKIYDKDISVYNNEDQEYRYWVPREDVRANLKYPCNYYVRRGYSRTILEKYDVGTCFTRGKPMYNRAVVPIYDGSGNFAIAFTGRDITSDSKHKWLHSKGYKKANYLYNVWYARECIEKTQTAILVEGPGDIWRLEEAGIHCGVALLGLSISQYQKILLSKMGVMNIVLLMDKGKAGEKATKKLVKSLSSLYNVCVPDDLPAEDIGESDPRWISENIGKILRTCFPDYGV